MNKRQEEKNNRLKNLSDSIVNCKLSVVGRAFSTRAGQLSLQVLVLGSVAIVLISGFVVWTDTYVKSVSRDVDKSQAFTITTLTLSIPLDT
jgi:cytochrome b subunit of formate dehydrogenase